MKKKIKIYRMPISRVFPATHPRKGELTHFEGKIRYAIGLDDCVVAHPFSKIHTIRANYEFWKKRIDEIKAGNAVLILFEWKEKPYRSKTNELFRFDKYSEIDVQKLDFVQNYIKAPFVYKSETENLMINYIDLSENDGLSEQDWKSWFKSYDLSEPMAIIHFTSFRY